MSGDQDPPRRADGAGLARAALERARAAAAAARTDAERAAAVRRRSATRSANIRRPRPDTDGADPLPVGAAIEALLADRGWQPDAAVATVTADWDNTVGAEIAAHCQPVSLRDGVLTVEAESTAWATQLRMLGATLLGRIATVAGAGVVTRLVVRGPAGPTWRHGRLRVPGRGPRDTYG